jgi:hypothetical protein
MIRTSAEHEERVEVEATAADRPEIDRVGPE